MSDQDLFNQLMEEIDKAALESGLTTEEVDAIKKRCIEGYAKSVEAELSANRRNNKTNDEK